MDLKKIAYWIATVVMCLIFLFSAFMYLTKYDMVAGFYDHLDFPRWVIYPLAILKILGVVAVLSNRSRMLKEWAYAGFFFDAVLATAAHHYSDGQALGLSAVAILVVIASRALDPYLGSKIS